jgi:hypothetical protein
LGFYGRDRVPEEKISKKGVSPIPLAGDEMHSTSPNPDEPEKKKAERRF